MLDRQTVSELGERFRGPLVLPEDPRYEQLRHIWNAMIDRRPGLIARCTGTADVVAAVRFARERGLLVSVRGGGHNVAGTAVCDDGLMIDLSPMKRIRVDTRSGTATAQPGVTLGDYDHEVQSHGMVTPVGINSTTGLAGLSLGGGIGWLMRRYGLTCDNLVEAEVVTADGHVLMVGADEEPELFWGLRGGGGNFGIVTSFRFRLHRLGPMVLSGLLMHPAERAGEALRFYRDFVGVAPDELGTIVNLRHAPPLPFVPEPLRGTPVVVIAVCYAGPVEEGARVVRPLREQGSPVLDTVGPHPYVDHQKLFDLSVPPGLNYYWKSEFLAELSDSAIDTLVDHAWRASSPKSYTLLFQLGGAVNRVEEGDTAFSERGAAFTPNINAAWEPGGPGEEDVEWVRAFWRDVQPFSTGRAYVNFLGQEGEDRVRAAYGEATFARLAELKRAWDPDNFFRVNQNIRPAAATQERSARLS